MRIVHLSDTHNLHLQLRNLPTADMIIHSGDISFAGTGEEVMDFIKWFGSLSYEFKIFVAGNHDYCLAGKDPARIQKFLPKNCYYLYNNGITICGIRFWGIPFFFAEDERSASNTQSTPIPTDTDILITHRPPFGILDNTNTTHYGCFDLLESVTTIQPGYHLFGHIHQAYGVETINGTTFSNASLVDGEYRLCNDYNIIDIG